MENSEKRPVLAILCLAYNHAKYIRDALEGFVMQKTNFPFVAIVHDDASTDNTADIVREYAQKYPDIIKPIYETENQYSKRDGSLGRIMNKACVATGAKYVALCEGDDYWTDPHKLQKQVDFLESHPEYSMCFGNAIEHWEDGGLPDKQFSNIEDRDYDGIELFANWIVPTATVTFRRDLYYSELYRKAIDCKDFCYGDILVFLTAADIGKVRGSDEILSIYRRHEGSAVYGLSYTRLLKGLIHDKKIPVIFGKKYKNIAQNIVASVCCTYSMYYFHLSEYGKAWNLLRISLAYALKYTFIVFWRRTIAYFKKHR